MRVLLISTYDLGRQPFGLASPAAWLRQAGLEVECVDASRQPLHPDSIRDASVVAFYLPMHTATRLAAPLLDRVRRTNPHVPIAAYGLYAPLNARWLRERGVTRVLGPESEAELVEFATGRRSIQGASVDTTAPAPPVDGRVMMADQPPSPDRRGAGGLPRLAFLRPDRTTLPPLSRYAALQMPDGTRRVVGSTEATRGCKHLCRHCPIVPVYHGTFRVIPIDVVLEDVRAQVAAGAQHIAFGDPDFFNGPAHARRLIERFAAEFPGVTYDVTIKIEHLLRHADLLPRLRDTGCLFVTSAVESVDDAILARLRKGHTRLDFVRAVEQCRAAGVTLSPTFVPFTPWSSVAGYVDLLEVLESLDLVASVAPIQLAIRLLVTADSALLELPELRSAVDAFDAEALVWPWRHADPRVDALQADVMRVVGSMRGAERADAFEAVFQIAHEYATGRPAVRAAATRRSPVPPLMTEAWYCCAEPGPELDHV